jgi:hypothetical protein
VPVGIKPHPSFFRMANEAALVIEGTAAADGTVAVTKNWFAAPGEVVGATVAVPTLPLVSKVPFTFGQKSEPIVPDAVLLFLVRAKDGTWEPLLRIDGDNPRGIVWFVGDGVFEYVQMINPGPYELRRAEHFEAKARLLTRPDEVRQQVAAGLVARGKWAEVKAIADADARARELVGWIGSQSPDGQHWYERVWADLGPAIRAEGRRAVPFLAKVVATHAEADAVSVACRSLLELGSDARDAVPGLIARLRDLRGASPADMVRALSSIPDERAIPVLLDLLDAKDGWLVEDVAIALKRAGATGFVDRIVQRIPRTNDEAESITWLADMLDAVREVDAALAEKIVRERFLDDAKLNAERQWVRQLRR